jgi:hypothetical protein
LQGDACDIMIFSPVVARDMLPRLVRWVVETEQVLKVAIARARGALHVVGDMQACLAGGGRLAEFEASVQADRYDLEVDGRGHLTDDALRSDDRRDAATGAEGIKVVQIDARTVFRRPDVVKAILSRLC